MRKVSQLALSLTLLATQANVPKFDFGNVAAADPVPTASASVYEVKLNTTEADPVVVTGAPQPDYDAQVLDPLHSAQAAEAAAAAAAAMAHKHRVVRTVVKMTAPVVAVTGSHADWMAEAGIAPSDFGYVDYIVSHESGWVWTKYNYRGSGAYGLGQALPAGKMAGFGADYMTNPVTQLRWANAYAISHYGSWAAAYTHWTARHSW